jgi:hypothetical protein
MTPYTYGIQIGSTEKIKFKMATFLTPEQFERWNRAALAEGKTLSRWAEDVLHAWAERCDA